MQQFMSMVLSIEIFIMCVSGSFYFIGAELGLTAIQRLGQPTNDATPADSLQNLNSTFRATASTYQTKPFDALLIFGDFSRAITNFMNIISGGYLFNVMQHLGIFPASFTIIIQVVFGLSVIMTLIYLVSGRG